jgi:hypothetical protein
MYKSVKLLALLLLAACASNPHRATKLETNMDKSTSISNEQSVGVKDGDMVYQKKVILSEELRSTMIRAHEQESHLYGGPRYYDNNGLIGELKSCRSQLAAMSDGKLQWTEKRDYIIPEEESFKMGLDENGRLVGVSEEYINDRISRFQQYRHTLELRTDDMQEKISACKSQVAFEMKNRSVASEK